MPGKKPANAVEAYLKPLQQSLSCFTKSVLRRTGCETDKVHVATFPGTSVPLKTGTSEKLYLSFVQNFTIQSSLLHGYKIKTQAYRYAIEDEYAHEIIAFHWHPESEHDTVPFAHLHLGHGSADRLRPELYKIHFETTRTAFEDVGILLLDYFNVEAIRGDAKQVLSTNLALFKKHKTW